MGYSHSLHIEKVKIVSSVPAFEVDLTLCFLEGILISSSRITFGSLRVWLLDKEMLIRP